MSSLAEQINEIVDIEAANYIGTTGYSLGKDHWFPALGEAISRNPVIVAAASATEELSRATLKNGTFNSYHEGYAVILEELDELWEEVRKNPRNRSVSRMRDEAVQVAAMALRFLVDLCGEEVVHGGSVSVPGATGVPGAPTTVPHQEPAPRGHEDDDGGSS